MRPRESSRKLLIQARTSAARISAQGRFFYLNRPVTNRVPDAKRCRQTDGNNKGGFFNGANLAGVFETGTLALTQSGLVTSLRVITDSPNATCAIAAREQLSDAKVYGPEEVITEGRVMTLVRGNYISARVSIPAGETWTYLRGLDDIKVKPGGSR